MSSADWRLDEVEGVLLARCIPLEGVAGIVHAFSTRVALGQSDFDLGPAEREDDSVLQRRGAFLLAAGFGSRRPAILRQVHGNQLVAAVASEDRPPEADGSYARVDEGAGSRVPAVRTADCVPLVFADRRGRAVAAVHAGWRGTAAGIAARAVAALGSLGVGPDELVVAMGPAIGACCYEVGDEVVAAVSAACPKGDFRAHRGLRGGITVDLHEANRAQLRSVGISDAAIHQAPWCTRCRNDLFFSVRAEGAHAGRLMAVVGPGPAP